MRFRLANIRQAAHRPAQPRRVVLTHPVPRPRGKPRPRPAHRPQGQAPPGWPPASLDPGEPADHAQTRGGKREQNVHITTNAPPLLDEPFHIRTAVKYPAPPAVPNHPHVAFCSAAPRRNVRAEPAEPAARATGRNHFAVVLPSVALTLPKVKSARGSANPGAAAAQRSSTRST